MPTGSNVLVAQATLANVNDAVVIGPLQDQNVVTCKFAGTLIGTVQCEVDLNGLGSWNNSLCELFNATVAGAPSQTLAGNDAVYTNTCGAVYVRFRMSAVTSGSSVAYARATNATPRAFTV